MFAQWVMSSVQVPLFCECPASALEHADINSMDAIAKILIVAVFMNYQGEDDRVGERSVRVFLVRKVYSDTGCSSESSRSSS